MQQYRLNYVLLIGLMVGTVVSAVVVYFVWDFQIKRRSVALVEEAEKARKAGDYRGVKDYLGQYLSIQPTDNVQRVKFADAYATLAEQVDTPIEERGAAVRVMESVLRDKEMRNEKDLRIRLAKFYGGAGMFKDALNHLNMITDDSEAQILKSQYLFQSQNFDEALNFAYKLIGYNAEQDKFEPEKAIAPKNAAAYLNTAMTLHEKKNRGELAERIIDQAVKNNPNSAEAYLARGRYFIFTKEMERGRSDVAKALEISPEDVEVLIAAEDLAVQEKAYDRARQLVEKGKKLHPKEPRFYQAGAQLLSLQKDYQGALKEIDEGLKAISDTAGRSLLLTRADLQLGAQDYAGMKQTIDRMKAAAFPPEYVEWYTAKSLIGEGDWFKANQLLNKLRPWVESRGPSLASDLYYFLGLSHQRLGQYDMAVRAYDSALERNPDNQMAMIGKSGMAPHVKSSEGLGENNQLQRLIADELKKPKRQQNWSKIQEAVDRYATENNLDETAKKLIGGRILLAREGFAEARKLAGDLFRADPKNPDVKFFAIQAVRFDPAPDQGPQAALRFMETLELEDQPVWRLNRADLLIATKDENVGPQLASLLTGIDSWKEEQKVSLWQGMADKFLAMNMVDEARRCLTLVAQAEPGDLQSRMKLFGLALDTNDDEAMKAAQDEVLKVVGSNSDSSWLSTEARRHLSLIRRNREPITKLDDVRQLVARALVTRPDWADLHLMNTEIELLAGRRKLALEHLDRADESGVLAPIAIAQHIRLLAQDGQLAKATSMLDKLPEQTRFPLLGEIYWELLFRSDKVEDAIKSARAEAEANPKNAQIQFRYGQLLARAADQPGVSDEKKKAGLEQAVRAVQQAVAIQPEFPDAWYSLIVFNAMAKNQEGALKTLRDAQLALTGDNLQLILAKSYEALNGWFDAEAIYRSIYEADPSDIDRVQQLAAFYVGPGYKGPKMSEKAAPLINQILRAGAEGKIPPNDDHLLWARRTGAKLLASTGDYQQLRKAEKMLASNSQDGSLSLEDRLEMAQILSSRPEPESLVKAAGLLEEIDKAQRLGEAQALMLGSIYNRLGKWDACKSYMRAATGRYRNSVRLHQVFVDMLLNHGKPDDLKAADDQIKELKRLAPQDPNTFALVARAAVKSGQKKIVQDELVKRVAKFTDPKSISDADANLLELYASLFIELGDFEHAEGVYRLLAKRDPKATKPIFDLARFVGTRRDLAQSFDLLESQFSPTQAQNVLSVAVDIVRRRRDEVGDRFDARIEGWFERALQNNPGSVPLLMAKAEFREVQKKYDEAAILYRELLANPDVTGIPRAVVLNNLSYLLALAGRSTAAAEVDPLDLVQEAAQILGPTADILDTRGVVWIARKRFDEAIADLSLSVSDNPTASKYFHKAQAHYGATQNKAALEAWAKAEELGLSRDSLNQLEQDRYEKFQAEMEKLRTGTTSVTATK